MNTTLGKVLTFRPRSVVAAILFAFVLHAPSDLSVAGLFSKKAKKNKVAARPKPFQTIFVPKKPSMPVRDGQPRLPRAVPVNAPEFAGALPAVARTRPDQLRIFILGDSQGLLPFGTELQKTLVDAGHEVLFHAVKNGTPYFWHGRWPSSVLTRTYAPAATIENCGQWKEVSMRPRSVAEYIESYDPDVFIFQAGTNFEEDLAGENTASIVAMIAESLRQASARGAKVLWIGPPDARDDVKSVEFQNRATATLRSALATTSETQGYDSFFDSRPVCPITNDTGGDGEHPTDGNGLLWGAAAGTWVADAIARWQCDHLMRPVGGSPMTPVTKLLTSRLEKETTAPGLTFSAELELVAKSDPGDITTLPYTDAFSVFQYRLRNPDQVLPLLTSLGISATAGSGGPTIYVLHWAVHNSGTGPRLTKIASSKVGETYTMQLCPLAQHPLGEPLGTMTQFNDFNDFLAPVFVASNFLDERTY